MRAANALELKLLIDLRVNWLRETSDDETQTEIDIFEEDDAIVAAWSHTAKIYSVM